MSKTFCWKDISTWPENWPETVVDPDKPAAYVLAQRLVEEYGNIIAYHGCRPLDVSLYYKNGLCVSDHSALISNAIEIFVGDKFKEISADDVLEAAKQHPGTDNHHLYLILDDRMLVERVSDYLLYGSEFILCIAARLKDKYGIDYSQQLRSIGKPTIFEVEIPLNWISDYSWLRGLACEISSAIAYNAVDHVLDYSLPLTHDIPHEFIRSHAHPQVIYDPYVDVAEVGEQKIRKVYIELFD